MSNESKSHRIIRKLNLAVIKIVEIVECILIMSLVIVVFFNSIMRYVFRASMFWANEVSCYILVWLVYGGIILALFDESHICFENKLLMKNTITAKAIRVLKHVAIMAVLLAFIIWGLILSFKNINSYIGTIKFPMGLVYSAVPLFAVLGLGIEIEKIIYALEE